MESVLLPISSSRLIWILGFIFSHILASSSAIQKPFEKGFFVVIRACQLLAQKNEGILLVGLAGPSGARMTSFTDKVLNFMPNVAVISMDNYNDGSRVIDDNFDDPRLTDYDTLLKNIYDLKEVKSVEVPIYDFKSSSRTGYRTLEVPSSCIVMVEGIYALSEKLRPFLDLRGKDGPGDSIFPVIKDQTQFSVAHARSSKIEWQQQQELDLEIGDVGNVDDDDRDADEIGNVGSVEANVELGNVEAEEDVNLEANIELGNVEAEEEVNLEANIELGNVEVEEEVNLEANIEVGNVKAEDDPFDGLDDILGNVTSSNQDNHDDVDNQV
ncbi:hypothetical protein SSX86_030338 [Deinandra increscens subsp. villosa]|uniref:Phosphoribulokinase/uridine kinase domain-containing protein n=1 Tax=Deinandra increscens subsp. villosa TaxID=3103831 RepID=A0AAP0CC23_9ASTR